MNVAQWVCLGIALVIVCFIAGAIGAYFETRKQSQNNENDKQGDNKS
jgi:uncharacterized protein YneF (UPF0154 family)